MKTINVSEATGPVLNWLVAKCEGHAVTILTVREQTEQWFDGVPESQMTRERESFNTYIAPTLTPKIRVLNEDNYKRCPTHDEAPMPYGKGPPEFSYASSPLQAWPIIDREKIGVWWDGMWHAKYDGAKSNEVQNADDALIAAMRCYVASKLGETAEVPEELL